MPAETWCVSCGDKILDVDRPDLDLGSPECVTCSAIQPSDIPVQTDLVAALRKSIEAAKARRQRGEQV